MGGIFGAILILALVVWGTARAGKSGKDISLPPQRTYTTCRCPTCGAQARVYGTQWECGWCGDFGRCTRK